jgi:DNA-binding response OmpR family regulator
VGTFRTVLVVKGDEVSRERLANALRGQGFGVREAADGETALEEYQHPCSTIDVVLADVQLNGMSGQQLLFALRSVDSSARVVLMCHKAGEHSTTKLRSLGAAGVLNGPIGCLGHLNRAIVEACNVA